MFDTANLIPTKADFSCGMAVMDKVTGWREGWEMNDEEPESSGIGGELAACMWIYSKAVLFDGQKMHGRIQESQRQFCHRSNKLVVQQVPPKHEWVSEFSWVIHGHDILKKLKFDIDVPCIVCAKEPS